jgi:hypothetical protein
MRAGIVMQGFFVTWISATREHHCSPPLKIILLTVNAVNTEMIFLTFDYTFIIMAMVDEFN